MTLELTADLGAGALNLALVLITYATIAAALAAPSKGTRLWRSAARAIHLVALTLTGVVALQVWFLAARVFQVAYVASNTSREVSLLYSVAALWAGENGSLLLWTWALAMSALLLTRQGAAPRLGRLATAIVSSLIIFFIVLVINARPFALLAFAPTNGQGLNPVLQTPWIYLHPLPLYFGYAGLTVPFAFALAALWTGQLDEAWLRAARRWAVVSWLLLTLAMVFGAQWAVRQDGWGGYWNWDPVENAALLPWLSSAAFFHSLMATERRAMLKKWTLALAALTWALVLIGAFLSRGGVVPSIHAFGATNRGSPFLYLAAFALLPFVALIPFRWGALRGTRAKSLLARESTLSLTNLILTTLALLILLASFAPWLALLFVNRALALTPNFYNQTSAPLWTALLIVMGICPLAGFGAGASRKSLHAFVNAFAFAAVGALLGAVLTSEVLSSAVFALGGFVLAGTLVDFWRGVAPRWRNRERNVVMVTLQLVARSRRHYGGYLVHMGLVLIALGVATTFAAAAAAIWTGVGVLILGTVVAVFPEKRAEFSPKRAEKASLAPARVGSAE